MKTTSCKVPFRTSTILMNHHRTADPKRKYKNDSRINRSSPIMKTYIKQIAISSLFALAGCSPMQQVMLAKASPTKTISVVARVPQDGNSSEMDNNLAAALRTEGISMKAPLPAGTRSANDVDAIISYGDSLRWEFGVCLRSLSVRMFDAQTGDLLVTGEWQRQNSGFRGLQDAKVVMQDVVSEMFVKLRAATK